MKYVLVATVFFGFYVVALNARERCAQGADFWCGFYQGMGGTVRR